MDFIAIASFLALVGAGVVVLLLHRLVGFKAPADPRQPDVSQEAPAALAVVPADAGDQIARLQAAIQGLQEQLLERETLDEIRWQTLEETREELREVRVQLRRLRCDFERRLHQSEESQRSRQRDLERQQGRELEWQRERELEQAHRPGPEPRPLASSR